MLFRAAVVGLIAVSPMVLEAQVVPAAPSDIIDVQASTFTSASCGSFAGMIAFDRRVVGNTVVRFSVPEGQVFVVTSVDWEAVTSRLNKISRVRLHRVIGGGTNGPSAIGAAMSDDTGVAGGSLTFPTGIVIESGTTFCARMDTGSTTDRITAVAHGFLTPAR